MDKKLTTDKYKKRPSPPYHANAYKDQIMKGNDGKMYISISNNGIYKWRLANNELLVTNYLKGIVPKNFGSIGKFIKDYIAKKKFKLFGSFPITNKITIDCPLNSTLRNKKDRVKKLPALSGEWKVYYLGYKNHWNKHLDEDVTQQRWEGAGLAVNGKFNILNLDKCKEYGEWSAINNIVGIFASEYWDNMDMIDEKTLKKVQKFSEEMNWKKPKKWSDVMYTIHADDGASEDNVMLPYGVLFNTPEMRGRYYNYWKCNGKVVAVMFTSLF